MSELKPFFGAGGGGGGGRRPDIESDNLRSRDTVEFVLALGEGQIKGLHNGLKTFFVGDVPLEAPDGSKNFDDFFVTLYQGAEDDPSVKPVLGGFAVASTTVNVPLPSDEGNVGEYINRQTTTGNINAIDVRIVVQSLYRQEKDGDVRKDEIKLRIEYKPLSSSTWKKFFNKDLVIKGKTTTTYVKEFRQAVDPISEPYQIRVSQLNSNSTKYIRRCTWESFQEISTKAIKLHNTAALHVAGRSTDQFASIPQFSGIYDGLICRVPTNYNTTTRTYSGTWDGTFKRSWTDDPAWILYEVVMNDRWGWAATNPDIYIDKYDCYAASLWCSEKIPSGEGSGTRPRFSFNAVISEPMQVREFARYIAGSFNAAIVDDFNGTIRLLVDKDDAAVSLFTPESITEGDFEYTYTDLSTWYNDITVIFTNPELDWEADRRRVYDQTLIDKYGRIEHEFVAVGCTNASEAIMKAKYRLYTATTETEMVSFKTNRRGLYISPFDVILIADPDRGYALTGRITGRSGTTVHFRDPIYLENGVSYKFKINTPSGVIERNITAGTPRGSVTSVILNQSLPANTPENADFSIEAEGVAGMPKPFRVLKVEEGEHSDDVTILAVEINRQKWAILNAAEPGPEIDYSDRRVDDIRPPQNLKIREITKEVYGQQALCLALTWDRSPSPMVRRYVVMYRRDDGPWMQLTNTSELEAEFLNVAAGNYDFEVYAQSLHGRLSKPATASYFIEDMERVVPGLANLRLVGQDGTEFFSPDCAFEWDVIQKDSLFASFEVTIRDTVTNAVRRTFHVQEPRATYFHSWNAADGLKRSFRVEVRQTDLYDNKSPAISEVFHNDPIQLPGIDVMPAIGGIVVWADKPSEPDFAGIRIYMSEESGFTPGPDNLVYDGVDTTWRWEGKGIRYFRVSPYDTFSKDDALMSIQYVEEGRRIVAEDIQEAQIKAIHIAANTIGQTHFADNLKPIGVSNGLPDPATWDGPDTIVNTEDGGLYYLKDGEWITAVPEVDLDDILIENKHIVDGAVDALKLAANAVTSAKIATGAVLADKLADAAVTARAIASEALNATHFAQGLNPVQVVDSLPDPATWDGSNTVVNREDDGLYYLKDGEWVANAPDVDLDAIIVENKHIVDGAVDALKLAANAVTSAKIASGAVLEDKLADAAVTARAIAANAISTENLQDELITAEKLVANAVTEAKLAASAVTERHLANAAVTAEKIRDEAIDATKFARNIAPPQIVSALPVFETDAKALAVSPGVRARTPHSAAVDITGDFALVARLSPDKLTWEDSTRVWLAKGSGVSSASWFARLSENGHLQIYVVNEAGTSWPSITSSISVVGRVAEGQPFWVGVSRVADDGEGNSLAHFYTSGDGVTWEPLGGPVTASQITPRSVDVPLSVGALNNGGQRFPGKIFRAQLYSGAEFTAQGPQGTLVADFNADDANFGDTEFFSSTTGEPWSILGDGRIVTENQGKLVILQSDGKLYRYDQGQWTAAVPTTDLSGLIEGQQLVDEAITAAKLAQEAVEAANIKDGAIISEKLAEAAVVAGKIAANAIITENLQDELITAEKIVANAVTQAKIAANAVTEEKLANAAIRARHIADGVINAAKFAEGIAAPQIVSSLPTTDNYEGRLVVYQGELHRYHNGSWTTAVKAVDVAGQLTNEQIAEIEAAKLTGQITEVQIKDNAISAPKLAAGSVVSDKVAANAIVAAKIATNAVETRQLKANAVTADKITSNAIEARHLTADSVTAGAIQAGAVGADQIAANAITADKIAGNTITASKMVVADTSNMVPDPYMEDDDSWTLSSSRFAFTSSASSLGLKRAVSFTPLETGWGGYVGTRRFPATPGEQYHAQAMISPVDDNIDFEVWFRVHWYDENEQELAPPNHISTLFNGSKTGQAAGSVTHLSNSIVAPEGARYAQVRVHGHETGTTGTILIGGFVFRLKTSSELIVDGAVTAEKITANAITGSHISANAIAASHISANSVGADQIASNAVTSEKILAGAIQAEHVAANAITTDKLAIGNFSNLLDDPSFEKFPLGHPDDPRAQWGAAGFWENASAGGGWVRSGNHSRVWRLGAGVASSQAYIRWRTLTPVQAGEEYLASVWIRRASAPFQAGTVHLRLDWFDKDRNYQRFISSGGVQLSSVSSAWQLLSLKGAAGPEDAFVRIRIDINNAVASDTDWSRIIFDDAFLGRVAESVMIADGAITAEKIVANAVTTDKIASGAVIADHIQANAVDAVHINAGAIGTGQLAANAITSEKIKANAISGDHIAANSVDTVHLVANAITAGQIAAGAVGADQIAANAITSDKVAANAITASKLAIGEFTNLVPDPGFDDPEAWSNQAAWYTVSRDSNAVYSEAKTEKLLNITASDGNNIVAGPKFRVYAGEELFTSYQLRAPDTTVNIGVALYDENDNVVNWAGFTNGIGTGTLTTYTKVFTVPEGAVYGRFRVVRIGGGQWGVQVAAPLVQRRQRGEMIVDGAITAEKVAANAITTSHISANSITGSEIAAGAVATGQLAANAVTTAKLAANAVTAAKIAAGTITGNEIAGRTIAGDKLIANTITADEVATNAIIARHIQANAVTAVKIAANAVTTQKLEANAVTAVKIAANAVTTQKLEANAVVAAKIASNAIEARHLTANSITAGAIAAGAVGADQIAANAITADKIAANAITTDKLAIGNFSNLLDDPGFELFDYGDPGEPRTGWGGDGAWENASAGGGWVRSGNRNRGWRLNAGVGPSSQATMHWTKLTPVRAGETYRAAIYVRRTHPFQGGSVALRLDWFNKDRNYRRFDAINKSLASLTTEWEELAKIATAEAEDAFVRIRIDINNAIAHAENTSRILFDDAFLGLVTESVMIADGAITAEKITANAITGSHISANAIAAVHIAAGAVNASSMLADNVVVTGHINANAITAQKINSNAIAARHIQANAVEAGHIKANAIETGHISSGAVKADQIAANAITSEKIAANAIVASKLAIGDFTNLIPNGSFETANPPGWENLPSHWSFIADSSAPSPYVLRVPVVDSNPHLVYVTDNMPCTPGDKFYLSCNARSSGAGSNTVFQIYARYTRADGSISSDWGNLNVPVSSTYNLVSRISTAPSNAYFVRFAVRRHDSGNDGRDILATNFQARRLSPSVLIEDGAITAEKITANAVITSKIAAEAITSAKIAANAITANKIAANAITATQIAANAVNASKIAANAVTADKIAANAVNASKIAANAVTAAKIASNAIQTRHLTAGSIRSQEIAANTIRANNIYGSAVNDTYSRSQSSQNVWQGDTTSTRTDTVTIASYTMSSEGQGRFYFWVANGWRPDRVIASIQDVGNRSTPAAIRNPLIEFIVAVDGTETTLFSTSSTSGITGCYGYRSAPAGALVEFKIRWSSSRASGGNPSDRRHRLESVRTMILECKR